MGVGRSINATGDVVFFDLVVSNTDGMYSAADSSRNIINGRFAQINFAANTEASLRVTVKPSCCTTPNCKICENSALSSVERDACYAAGCCCYGVTVTDTYTCVTPYKEIWQDYYNCPGVDDTIILPPTALVGMSVFDLDRDAASGCTEKLTASGYEYFKTPLRPAAGTGLQSTLIINTTAAPSHRGRRQRSGRQSD